MRTHDGWDAGDREPPHGDPLADDALGREGEDPFRYREPPPYEEPLRDPRGYDPPRRERRPPPRGRGLDLAAIFVLLDSIRRVLPRELEHQLTALIREFLLTLRALIDLYLDRLDRGTREPEVEEIRID